MCLKAQEADDVCLQAFPISYLASLQVKRLTIDFVPISKSFLFTRLAGPYVITPTETQIK
jgi:hypothetical protein